MLFKVGRFDLAKRWLIAVEAAAQLKAEGHRIVFPMIGGIEPHGAEVLARAHELGLSITHVTEQPESWAGLLQTLRRTPSADIYNLRFYVSQEILRPFYASADGVLANSGHEPFGLVGLEAMAAGGLVFTGTTGEEYTLGGQCAIALDTDSPEEIVSHLLTIRDNPGQDEAMRKAARDRAADFTWEQVTKILLNKLQFVTQASGALPRPNGRNGLVVRSPATISGQPNTGFFVPPSEDRNFPTNFARLATLAD
jgi:glycosyltransferase involved in cell wall biosynthesis